jgi:hypothetical protein
LREVIFFPENRGMNCELRPAEASDEPFLREMLYLALFVPPGQPPLPQSVLADPAIARYVEGWGTRSGDSGLIALVQRVPVGAAWLRFFPASDPGYGFVDERTPERVSQYWRPIVAKELARFLVIGSFKASMRHRLVATLQIRRGASIFAWASHHWRTAGPCCV